jgi:fluoroquinolone transport system permease protein
MIFSILTGFVLLDERDDQTLTALQVTPLPLSTYFAYRITVPIILTIALMFVILPLGGIGVLAPWKIAITAIAAAPMAPMFALFLASLAQNKVQGFALAKLAGLPLLLPTFAFFIDSGWEYAFGLIPSYWPMKVYWMLSAGEPGVWFFVLVAVVYQLALTQALLRRFSHVMHR